MKWDSDDMIRGFSQEEPSARKKVYEAVTGLAAPGIVPLMEILCSSDPKVKTLAETALFDLCVHARNEGDRSLRKVLSKLQWALRKGPSVESRVLAAELMGVFDESRKGKRYLRRSLRRAEREQDFRMADAARCALFRMGEAVNS